MPEGRDGLTDIMKRLSSHGPIEGEGRDTPDDGLIPSPTEQPTTPATEPTRSTESGSDEELDEILEEENEEVCSLCGKTLEEESCNHQPFVALTIALGILSLVLTGAVVLLILRRGKAKLRRRRKDKDGKAAPETAPAAAAPAAFTGIQVGKLHQIGDRDSQQDCLAVSPTELYGAKGILAVVADGMGGLSDGDKVSQAAATAMMNGFMVNREASAELILGLTVEANQAVNRLLGPANQGRSGTTLVAGIVYDGLFSYVSVGDSRICLYRQGLLTQLNREHIYRNELRIQAVNGQGTLWDAGTHPKAAGLTSYLGMGNLKYVDIPAEPLRVCAGDKIILMSDGVYNAMTLPEMEAALALPAQQAADTIGAAIKAKAYRHQDNYTAVILQF